METGTQLEINLSNKIDAYSAVSRLSVVDVTTVTFPSSARLSLENQTILTLKVISR